MNLFEVSTAQIALNECDLCSPAERCQETEQWPLYIQVSGSCIPKLRHTFACIAHPPVPTGGAGSLSERPDASVAWRLRGHIHAHFDSVRRKQGARLRPLLFNYMPSECRVADQQNNEEAISLSDNEVKRTPGSPTARIPPVIVLLSCAAVTAGAPSRWTHICTSPRGLVCLHLHIYISFYNYRASDPELCNAS